MIGIHHGTAQAFADAIIDNFEKILEQCEGPLVDGISLQAFIVGQPFRLRHMRRALQVVAKHNDSVWLATTGAIAAHYASLALPEA
jgi:allantoinase